MAVIEKLGSFYLGATDKGPLYYPSKNLTTHAVCVGMTGSGKTGLAIDLLEEAALDGIPAIIIDPKGDVGDLMLMFPEQSAEEFYPWVDPEEAKRAGESPKQYSETLSKQAHKNLKESGQSADRIAKIKETTDIAIYTPAYKAGRPLSILSSFAAPSKETLSDEGAFRDRVMSTASGLLGLLGIDADPIKSREHILISNILTNRWQEGKDLDIAEIIRLIQKPPFSKIGVLDIDTFFPLKERMALSINLNNLLASPGFKTWLEGEPMAIQSLLYTKEGKPRMAILSIAHLSDNERMFFVTLLLNQFLDWMRKEPGSSSLKAILYMDEIFGYFPPTKQPPSKLPMITLLKQGRAFGVGVVLSTQNPVDLDYKGLSNCGTWFIGKLQTERDKSRIIEGLKAASNGGIDGDKFDKLLSKTGHQTFILQSIYEKEPIVFKTRWALSYLRGPLTLNQIVKLVEKPISQAKEPAPEAKSKPEAPPSVAELFSSASKPLHYKPYVAGFAKLHFVDSKNKVDVWKEAAYKTLPLDNGKSVDWNEGESIDGLKNGLVNKPVQGSSFDDLPEGIYSEKAFSQFHKDFFNYLYQNESLSIFEAPEFKLISKAGETEDQFKERLKGLNKDKINGEAAKIKDKYEIKISQLNIKIKRAEQKAEARQTRVWSQMFETFISVLTTVIGSLFGKKITKTTISQAGTTLRRAGRIKKDSQEVEAAAGSLQDLQNQLEDLKAEEEQEIKSLEAADPVIQTLIIKPRKSDLTIEKMALLWLASE